MKILIYYEQLGYGGVDTHLANLINCWPNQFDSFFIVTNSDNQGLSHLESSIRRKGVKLIPIVGTFWRSKRSDKAWIRFARLMSSLYAFLRVFRVILENIEPDYVISNCGGYPSGWSNWISAYVAIFYYSSCRRVALLIHHSVTSTRRSAVRLVTYLLCYPLHILQIPVVTVSKASKLNIERYSPFRNIVYIYNGIDYRRVATRVAIDLMPSQVTVKHKLKVGILGRIEEYKGHQTILEAFSKSGYIRDTAHLYIIGTGDSSQLSLLESKIEVYGITQNVSITGYIEGSSLDIVSALDVLVVPTVDFEGFGYSMAEAMFCGVPVVASNVGAIPEIVVNGESGIIIESPTVVSEWVCELEKLLRYEHHRRRLGEGGRKRIAGDFAADKMSKGFYSFILHQVDGCTPYPSSKDTYSVM